MISYRKFLILIFSSILLFSCVSSGEYKAKLAEIDALKGDNASLEEKLKEKEKELAKIVSEKEKLETDIKNKDEELITLKIN